MYSNGFGYISSYDEDTIQTKSNTGLASLSQDIFSYNEALSLKKGYSNGKYPPKYFPAKESDGEAKGYSKESREEEMEKLRQHLANKFQRINVAKTDTEQSSQKEDTLSVHETKKIEAKLEESLDDTKSGEVSQTTSESEDLTVKENETIATTEGNLDQEEEDNDSKVPHISEPPPHLRPDLNKVVLFTRFNVPVKKLFDTLQGEDTRFIMNWLLENKNYDITIGEWTADNSGALVRDFDYKLEVVNTFVSGTTTINVKNIIDKASEEHRRYVVDSISSTKGIKFSDKFLTKARYLFRAISDHESEMRVSVEVAYVDNSLWGVVKSAIERNVFTEVDVSLKSLGSNLYKEFSKEQR